MTTHLPQHQSYHIFITIITLANNKTKKEKHNIEANGSSVEKKNCPQQSRRAEEEEEEEKEKERARSHLD